MYAMLSRRIRNGVSTILKRSLEYYRSDVTNDKYEGYVDIMPEKNRQFVNGFPCVKHSFASRPRLKFDKRLKAQI